MIPSVVSEYCGKGEGGERGGAALVSPEDRSLVGGWGGGVGSIIPKEFQI